MPYTINTYNNTEIAVVEDATIDDTTDLRLVGKNYPGYGELQNENFVYLMENFAGEDQPKRPIRGQLWYDLSEGERVIKFFDGTDFRPLSIMDKGPSEPVNSTVGNLWWNTDTNQLYGLIYDSATDSERYDLIGPQRAGPNMTQMRSKLVKDTSGNDVPLIVGIVDGKDVFTISSVDFSVDNSVSEISQRLDGFDTVRKGITFSSGGSVSDPYLDVPNIILRNSVIPENTSVLLGDANMPFDSAYVTSIISTDIVSDTLECGSFNVTDMRTNSLVVSGSINADTGDELIGSPLSPFSKIYANDFYTPSDRNKKTDITRIDSALNKILQLQGVEFTWKSSGKKSIGLIAQDVKKVVPEVVDSFDEDNLSVMYGNLVSLLIEGIKEVNENIILLKDQIEKLKLQSS